MQNAQAVLAEATEKVPALVAWRFQCGTNIGACLYVPPSTSNGTYLGAQEWRDALFLKYDIDPPYLFSKYGGCSTVLSIYHAIYCKDGGLVESHQNELRDRFTDLSENASPPLHVHNDPITYPDCAVQDGKAHPARRNLGR